MIHHVVLWKFSSDVPKADKKPAMEQMKQQLEGLTASILQINLLLAHCNHGSAADANFDIMLHSAFRSMDDLNLYQSHPDHLRVAGFIKSLGLQRAAIDFEY
jgi:hypothetical protein